MKIKFIEGVYPSRYRELEYEVESFAYITDKEYPNKLFDVCIKAKPEVLEDIAREIFDCECNCYDHQDEWLFARTNDNIKLDSVTGHNMYSCRYD